MTEPEGVAAPVAAELMRPSRSCSVVSLKDRCCTSSCSGLVYRRASSGRLSLSEMVMPWFSAVNSTGSTSTTEGIS